MISPQYDSPRTLILSRHAMVKNIKLCQRDLFAIEACSDKKQKIKQCERDLFALEARSNKLLKIPLISSIGVQHRVCYRYATMIEKMRATKAQLRQLLKENSIAFTQLMTVPQLPVLYINSRRNVPGIVQQAVQMNTSDEGDDEVHANEVKTHSIEHHPNNTSRNEEAVIDDVGSERDSEIRRHRGT